MHVTRDNIAIRHSDEAGTYQTTYFTEKHSIRKNLMFESYDIDVAATRLYIRKWAVLPALQMTINLNSDWCHRLQPSFLRKNSVPSVIVSYPEIKCTDVTWTIKIL